MSAARLRDPCEFDPQTGKAVESREKAHASADVIVGANGQWRLCASCADRPEFRRFRKRREVAR